MNLFFEEEDGTHILFTRIYQKGSWCGVPSKGDIFRYDEILYKITQLIWGEVPIPRENVWKEYEEEGCGDFGVQIRCRNLTKEVIG